MSANLLDFLDNDLDNYSLNELFILYYISHNGIEPVSFKVLMTQYQFLKVTNSSVHFKQV